MYWKMDKPFQKIWKLLNFNLGRVLERVQNFILYWIINIFVKLQGVVFLGHGYERINKSTTRNEKLTITFLEFTALKYASKCLIEEEILINVVDVIYASKILSFHVITIYLVSFTVSFFTLFSIIPFEFSNYYPPNLTSDRLCRKSYIILFE